MAANRVHENVTDISSVVLPLQMKLKDKDYKFLVRGTDVKFISDRVAEVSAELTALVPDEVPDDPIYFTFINGKVHIPEVVLSKFEKSKVEDKDGNNNQEDGDQEIIESENYEPDINVNDESSEDDNSSRFDWKFGCTKLLLSILKERKEKKETFCKNVWKKVAQLMRDQGVGKKHPTAEQCREKFYSLRRGYRKYTSEKKKTGNRRLKPFIHETEMYDILHDDPSFNPPVLKSSLGTEELNSSNSSCSSSSSGSSKSNATETERKAPKRKHGELVEYLKERDDKFLVAFQDMQEKKKLMEKLIEKL